MNARVLIGAGIIGAAVLAYAVTRASAPPTQIGGTITLQPGTQSIVWPLAGFTIALPPGAVWAAPNQHAGSSAPIVVPADSGSILDVGGVVVPMHWTDATGTSQTTYLEITPL